MGQKYCFRSNTVILQLRYNMIMQLLFSMAVSIYLKNDNLLFNSKVYNTVRLFITLRNMIN